MNVSDPLLPPPTTTTTSSSSSSSSSSLSSLPSSFSYRTRLSQTGCTGSEVRSYCRNDRYTDHTSGVAPGYAQANIVIVPAEYAYDFLLFCTRNPIPCPLLEVTDNGTSIIRTMAKNTDLRTDLPKYIVLRNGQKEEMTNILALWPECEPRDKDNDSNTTSTATSSTTIYHPDHRTDWVGFLLGCSFSFEEALLEHRIPVRHLQQNKEEDIDNLLSGTTTSVTTVITPSVLHSRAQQGTIVANPRNVPMYRTTVPNTPAGIFKGNLVVSMRPMTIEQAHEATVITALYPRVHGKPVHIGNPSILGIKDIGKPDYGDPVTILSNETPVFWACGVTPLAALTEACLPIAITHAPGHMLVLDILNKDITKNNDVQIQPES